MDEFMVIAEQWEQMKLDIKELQTEVKILRNEHPKNDFIIKGNKEAMKIVHCCEQKLKKARDNGILILGEDYKFNGSYTYSKSSLYNKRGEI